MAIAEGIGGSLGRDNQGSGNVFKFQVEGQGFSISNFNRERRIKLLHEGPINVADDFYHTFLNSFPCAEEVPYQEMADMYANYCDGYFAFTLVTGELSLEGSEKVHNFRDLIDVSPVVFFSGTPEPVANYLKDPLWSDKARVLKKEGYERIIIPTPEQSIHYNKTRFMYGFDPDNRLVLQSA